MPFHNGVFYPLAATSETQQGVRSFAGTPTSLLNSPISQPFPPTTTTTTTSSCSGGAGMAFTTAFRFRARRESVDWRRLGAVDVERVVSELDVDALQEHIAAVAFCDLQGERCPRCRGPVDPALVKLLRLAQLTVEWLLHCQGLLSEGLRQAEERLAAAGEERQRLLAERAKLEERMKEMAAELKQRKKFIRTQQTMLGSRFIGNHKCVHCDKSFISSSFLQNHLQRRHPDEYDMQVRSDSDRRSQVEILKVEISSLKEQLSQQQQALLAKTAQEKEQETLHRDLQKELERFKAEEMARMERKIEDSRDGMRREMEYLYGRNLQARNDADQTQRQREMAASPVQRQPERDLESYKEMQAQAIQKMEHKLKKQDKKWEARLQEIEAQHEHEKNQWLSDLSRMQASVSEQQGRSQRKEEELRRTLQEKEQTILAQRDKIKSISSHPPKVAEVPAMSPVILTAPASEPKPKRVAKEQPPSVAKLDPIQELSDEEKGSSPSQRGADRKPAAVGKRKGKVAAIRALRGNPDIKRELRPGVEQAHMEALERLGVRTQGQSGLAAREFSALMAKASAQREARARDVPDYRAHRQAAARVLEQLLSRGHRSRRGSDPAPRQRGNAGVARAGPSADVSQLRPRSSSLPSNVTQVRSGPSAHHPSTPPQPAPRTRAPDQPWTSTPNAKTAPKAPMARTPPFSSDEESEEEEAPKPPVLQTRAGEASPAVTRRPTPAHSQPRAPGGGVGHTPVRPARSDEDDDDDDDDWTEGSVLQEINKESTVGELSGRLASHVTNRSAKRPAGGGSVLLPRSDAVQELTYTDAFGSISPVSSLEEENIKSAPKAKQGFLPVRKSLDTPSTSVWGTSTGRKSGLTEAGTGSTLKSALSLSDFSDSDDM